MENNKEIDEEIKKAHSQDEIVINEEETKKEKKKIKKNLDYYFYNERDKQGKIDISKMKIIGWCLMIVTAFATGFKWFTNANNITNMTVLTTLLSYIGSLSVSALMIASFSNILQNQKRGARLVNIYGICAILIIIVFCMLYFFYTAKAVGHLLYANDYSKSIAFLNKGFAKLFGKSLKFNFFIDLFMFSLFTLFLFYTPEKIKDNRKHVVIYRLLSAIPLLYILAAFILNVLNSAGVITFKTWVYPLLPTKSPLMFISLSTVAVITKIREDRFKKKYHHTEEEYQVFFNSKSNSWLVAKTFAWCLLIFGLIDLIVAIVLAVRSIYLSAESYEIYNAIQNLLNADGTVIAGQEAEYERLVTIGNKAEAYYNFINTLANNTGIGTACLQIFFAPVVLNFTFNKPYKPTTLDYFVPFIGIGGMLFMYIHWGLFILMTL